MGWSKRHYIEQAYAEIGLAGYVFDLTSEQLDAAVSKLDAMMAAWIGKGIRVGYPIGASPDSNNIDAETSVPDVANEAIYMNLALRLAGTVGKQSALTQETRNAARSAYNDLLSKTVTAIPVLQPVTMIAGQGNRRYSRQVFVNPPAETLDTGFDGTVADLELE